MTEVGHVRCSAKNAVTWESSVSVAVSDSQLPRASRYLARLRNPTGVAPRRSTGEGKNKKVRTEKPKQGGEGR